MSKESMAPQPKVVNAEKERLMSLDSENLTIDDVRNPHMDQEAALNLYKQQSSTDPATGRPLNAPWSPEITNEMQNIILGSRKLTDEQAQSRARLAVDMVPGPDVVAALGDLAYSGNKWALEHVANAVNRGARAVTGEEDAPPVFQPPTSPVSMADVGVDGLVAGLVLATGGALPAGAARNLVRKYGAPKIASWFPADSVLGRRARATVDAMEGNVAAKPQPNVPGVVPGNILSQEEQPLMTLFEQGQSANVVTMPGAHPDSVPAHAVLDKVIEGHRATSPDKAKLAQELKQFVHPDTPVVPVRSNRTVPTGDEELDELVRAAGVSPDGTGFYAPEIGQHGAVALNVGGSPNEMLKDRSEVVIHELSHAATSKQLADPANKELTARLDSLRHEVADKLRLEIAAREAGEAAPSLKGWTDEEVNELLFDLDSQSGIIGFETSPYIQAGIGPQSRAEGAVMYGLSSNDEFIAEAWGNRYFARFLADIDVGQKLSAKDRFMEIIGSLLRLDKKSRDALSETIWLSKDISKGKFQGLKAAPRKATGDITDANWTAKAAVPEEWMAVGGKEYVHYARLVGGKPKPPPSLDMAVDEFKDVAGELMDALDSIGDNEYLLDDSIQLEMAREAFSDLMYTYSDELLKEGAIASYDEMVVAIAPILEKESGISLRGYPAYLLANDDIPMSTVIKRSELFRATDALEERALEGRLPVYGGNIPITRGSGEFDAISDTLRKAGIEAKEPLDFPNFAQQMEDSVNKLNDAISESLDPLTDWRVESAMAQIDDTMIRYTNQMKAQHGSDHPVFDNELRDTLFKALGARGVEPQIGWRKAFMLRSAEKEGLVGNIPGDFSGYGYAGDVQGVPPSKYGETPIYSWDDPRALDLLDD